MFPVALLDAPTGPRLGLRSLLEAEPYLRSESRLTLALGQSDDGVPFVYDLATLPHLLVAGASGSGKSVALHAFLATLLHRVPAEEIRLILIDCQSTGFAEYNGIPHLLGAGIADPTDGSNAVEWAAREIEQRYHRLSAAGVRNITRYNAAVERSTSRPFEGRLPHVVIVVDELAHLMRACGASVQQSLVSIAQLGRAVGIHLILATREFSVDVLTGLIKANIPARIAFRVTAAFESRSILDRNGAERLAGAGDMLFLPPTSSTPVRLRAPYVSRVDISQVAAFLRAEPRS